MQKVETSWRSSNEWKARYSKLYSSQRISLQKVEEPRRISFMSNDSTPYSTLLSRMRGSSSTSSSYDSVSTPYYPNSALIDYNSRGNKINDNLGGTETLLLDMVRSRSSDVQSEARDKPTSLPVEDESEEETNDVCMHGLNYRSERSMSRSRVSRMSTRRDMDIPSILAFPINITAPVQLEIPAFHKAPVTEKENIPKWSIRRSVCPVCSQKWKDWSSIKNIKSSDLCTDDLITAVINLGGSRALICSAYLPFECEDPGSMLQKVADHARTHGMELLIGADANAHHTTWGSTNINRRGLKRNLSLELPSVIAPARLRTSIESRYAPRPVPAAVDEEARVINGGLRQTSTTWQLTRARRFRIPKPRMPSPEAIAPPSSAAPLARKDLHLRVTRFLKE